MKSLMSLYEHLLADASRWCRTSTIRDLKTVTDRFEHEGLSFLTITLPNFCRDFEESLDRGFVGPTSFPSFRKRGHLPLFLGGFCDLVFDRNSGRLLPEPDHCSVFFIRQLTLCFKKIKVPCSEERETAAFRSYGLCEQKVSEWSRSPRESHLDDFLRMSRSVWSSVFCRIDRKVNRLEHVPKHGPGSTSERLLGNSKFKPVTWPTRLEESFPSADFLIPNQGFYEGLDEVNFLEPDAEMPVRVISVPKTLKAPRIIAIEPVAMQYTQQSLLELFVEHIESDERLAQCVGFTDQTPNQRMARIGSLDGSLATIDLSEASDRVSNRLAELLMNDFPFLKGAVQSCRSTHADVPSIGVIPLTKFASMGSALCFPVMAMTILVIVCLGRQKMLNRHLRESDLRQIFRKVRIYGDDIIVPVEWVQSVIVTLEDFGLKVNTNKSFWTGMFRESCGKDYYAGSDVTVTYLRQCLPRTRRDVEEILSAISFRNQLYKAGLWSTCGYMDSIIRKLAKFPIVEDTSPIKGRTSFLPYVGERQSDSLHRPEVFGLLVKPKYKPSELDDWYALMKFFLRRGIEPFAKDHLRHYGRPDAVDIKHGWSTPY